jgi:hypothetical protein
MSKWRETCEYCGEYMDDCECGTLKAQLAKVTAERDAALAEVKRLKEKLGYVATSLSQMSTQRNPSLFVIRSMSGQLRGYLSPTQPAEE